MSVSRSLRVLHKSTDSHQGEVRLLKYAQESKNLFFTTTLQNSVQSYSLEHSKLLDPAHTHPSPPSVFALSCTSQYLLSTSPAPPTIHLASLTLHTPPVLLRPQFSSSAVVAADFHPEQENYFCLAFADGTAAVYDANHFYDSHDKGKRRENAAVSRNGGEKAFIRGLHNGNITKNAEIEAGVTLVDGDPGTNPAGIGLKQSCISAVAFVPGRKATVVTVGADGKCCVVDFTQPTKHKAVLLKSWHIRRPATSLSIICSAKKAIIGQCDGAHEHEPEQRKGLPNDSYYIAVGRSDGRVLLFDLDGKPLGEQALDDTGDRIIDVEWTQIRNGAMLSHQNPGSGIRRSPGVKKKRKSLGSSAFVDMSPSQIGPLNTSPNMAEHSEDPLFDFTTPRKTLGTFHWEPPSDAPKVAPIGPRNGAREGNEIVMANKSNNGQQRSTRVTTQTSSGSVRRNPNASSLQAETELSSSSRSSTEDGSTPPIPPRPNPKPGGRLSMHRAQTSHQSDIQSISYLSMVAKARKVSATNHKLSQGLPIANPPTKTKVLFGPRKPSSSRTNTSRTRASEVQTMSEQPEDVWLDVPPETPRRATEVSPVSSVTSNKSYKTAMSHLYNSDSPERSDDTVVDWSVGLPRQPIPTLRVTHPSGEIPSTGNPKRKGHISLSVSSESASTPPSTPSVSDGAVSPISGPRTGFPPKSPTPLKATVSIDLGAKLKAEPKHKGHAVSSVSSASDGDTITPRSSESEGQIVQWPSLKKSPRIPELNKGLPDPKKHTPLPSSSPKTTMTDSATDIIIQGYTASPPSTPRAVKTPWLVSTAYPEREAPLASPPKATSKPVPFSAVHLEREPQGGPCTCNLAIKSTLEASLTSLRAEITQSFESQRKWFEGLMRGEDEGRTMLAEENRWLRSQLAEIEQEKEK